MKTQQPTRFAETVRKNFSLQIHTLCTNHMYPTLTKFEQNYLTNSARFLPGAKWGFVPAQHIIVVRNIFLKYTQTTPAA